MELLLQIGDGLREESPSTWRWFCCWGWWWRMGTGWDFKFFSKFGFPKCSIQVALTQNLLINIPQHVSFRAGQWLFNSDQDAKAFELQKVTGCWLGASNASHFKAPKIWRIWESITQALVIGSCQKQTRWFWLAQLACSSLIMALLMAWILTFIHSRLQKEDVGKIIPKEWAKNHQGIFPLLTSLHFTSLHFTSLPFPSLPFPSLPFPSLPFPSLPFPSLPFPSLPFPSLPFPSLPFPSLPFTSLHFTSLHFTSLHFTSLHFTSLHFTSLHFTSLHFTSLHFTSLGFSFCQVTVVHNLLLSIGSLVMFLGTLLELLRRWSNSGSSDWFFCENVRESAGALYFWSYVYYLSKYYEMCLRRSPRLICDVFFSLFFCEKSQPRAFAFDLWGW